MLTQKQKEYWDQIHKDELEIPDLVEKHLKELRATTAEELYEKYPQENMFISALLESGASAEQIEEAINNLL